MSTRSNSPLATAQLSGGWAMRVAAIVGLALCTIMMAGCSTGKSAAGTPSAGAKTSEAHASPTTTRSISSPTATATPKPPTATPTPIPPTPTPTPIALSGTGQTATSPVALSSGIWLAHFSYTGQSNFIVHAFNKAGDTDYLVNAIGNYSGVRPLAGNDTYTFDIDSSGPWTLTIDPIGVQLTGDASGSGDFVTGVFPVKAGPQPFAFSHSGKANFIVHLTCDGGEVYVENEIGPVNGSRVVNVPAGSKLCFWDITADGAWTIAAKS